MEHTIKNTTFPKWLEMLRSEEKGMDLQTVVSNNEAEVAYEKGYTPHGMACEELFFDSRIIIDIQREAKQRKASQN